MSVELYPELVDYIWHYYFYTLSTDVERKACRHHEEMKNRGYRKKQGFPESLDEDDEITTDELALSLLDNGFESFKEKVVERVYVYHYEQLNLNTCPACGKIARTPFAKQCRFCYHDWH